MGQGKKSVPDEQLVLDAIGIIAGWAKESEVDVAKKIYFGAVLLDEKNLKHLNPIERVVMAYLAGCHATPIKYDGRLYSDNRQWDAVRIEDKTIPIEEVSGLAGYIIRVMGGKYQKRYITHPPGYLKQLPGNVWNISSKRMSANYVETKERLAELATNQLSSVKYEKFERQICLAICLN